MRDFAQSKDDYGRQADVSAAWRGRTRPAGSHGSATAERGSDRAHRVAPPKFYRIGEVVEYSGVSRQTIHNYTTMGLLHECRWTPGGHRLYDESVFLRLEEIAAMKARNKTLRTIREYFARVDGDNGDGMFGESTDHAGDDDV